MAFHNISFVKPEVKVSNTSEWMNEYQVIDKFHSKPFVCLWERVMGISEMTH